MDVASMDNFTLMVSLAIFWLAVVLLLLYVIKATRAVDRRIKYLTRNEGT
jgi:uncharacterized protein YoxC